MRVKGDVVWLSRLLEEKDLGPNRICIIPMIESPLGVVNVESISRASTRILGIAFGAADLVRDDCWGHLQTRRIPHAGRFSADGLFSLESCTGAAVTVMLGIDSSFFSLKDIEGLRSDAKASRSLGYMGKMTIHPAQTGEVNDAFCPSTWDVGHARKIIVAYRKAEEDGLGAISLEGKMIDRAMHDDANSLLEYARAIARLPWRAR